MNTYKALDIAGMLNRKRSNESLLQIVNRVRDEVQIIFGDTKDAPVCSECGTCTVQEFERRAFTDLDFALLTSKYLEAVRENKALHEMLQKLMCTQARA